VLKSKQVPVGEARLQSELASIIQHIEDIDAKGTKSLGDIRERLARVEVAVIEFKDHGSPALTPRIAALETQMISVVTGISIGVSDDAGHQHRLSTLEVEYRELLDRVKVVEHELHHI